MGSHQDSSRGEVGVSPQKDLDRLVEEDPEEDSDVTIVLDSFTHNYLVFCLCFIYIMT